MVIWVRSCSRSTLTLTFTWWKQNWRIASQIEVICDKRCNFSLILAQLKLSRVEWIKATATHIEAITLTLRLFQVNLHMNFPMVVLKLTIHQCLTSKLDAHSIFYDHDVVWVQLKLMVSNSADIGTIVLEIIKCEANLVSDFFVIFKPNYLHKIPAS